MVKMAEEKCSNIIFFNPHYFKSSAVSVGDKKLLSVDFINRPFIVNDYYRKFNYNVFSIMENNLMNYIKSGSVKVIVYHSFLESKSFVVQTIKKVNEINPKIKQIIEFPMSSLDGAILYFPRYKIIAGKPDSLRLLSGSGLKNVMLKDCFNDFLSADVDGFIATNDLSEWVEPKMLSFTKYLLSDAPPKLYIISAPSGYGKSTLADRLKYVGVRQLPKVTTRTKRHGEENSGIKFMSQKEFKTLFNEGQILNFHEHNGNLYGFLKEDFDKISNSHRTYAIDSCDYESARKVKFEYPDKVNLVNLFPSLSFAGFGLEERISKLNIPTEGFGSFIEELEFLKRSRYTIQDTKDRLKRIIREAREFERNIPLCDIVLDKYSIEENEALLLEKMAE